MDCILLHGWGVSNTIWQEFGNQLTVFNNVSTPCLYEAARQTEDNELGSIASALNKKIKSDSVIVAWSIGGLVATHIAKLTDKVKGIVFIASPPCFVNKEGWLNVMDKKNIERLKKSLLNDAEGTFKYFSGLIAHGDVSARQTNKNIRNNLANKNNKEALETWLVQMQQTDQRKEWAKINLPMQMILGEKDSLINSKIQHQIKSLSSNIEIDVIKDCGHAPFISKQEDTTKIINEFINAKFD